MSSGAALFEAARQWSVWKETPPHPKRGAHRHDSNPAKLERKKISAACKRKVTDNLYKRPSKIMRSVLSENIPPTFTSQDRELVRQNVYNARQHIHPFKKPRNIEMVHMVLKDMTIVTCKDEPFLLLNNSEKNVIIFSCHTNLEVLCTIDTFFMDGTFEYCTKFFKQLFTLHGIKNGHYIQLVYALLPDKTTQSYKNFIDELLGICPTFKPKVIVVDLSLIHISEPTRPY